MDRLYAQRGGAVSRAREESVEADRSRTFEESYVREFRAVVRLAYALSGSRSASEDLAQEAFLAAHRQWDRIGSYERPDVFGTAGRREHVDVFAPTSVRRSTSARPIGDQTGGCVAGTL